VKSTAFYLGLSLLFTHELDSMPNHEWRVLPVLRSLSDSAGEMTFLIAHVPLFFLVIAFVASLNQRTRANARNILCGFLIVHALLHYFFANDPAYEFSTLLSSTLIYGAALCGAACFLISDSNDAFQSRASRP
jgi:hypothetical protein